MIPMRHLDLCSGIGGFALAARWTRRIETVAFCEIEKYCRRVIAAHWPGIPILEDIYGLTAATLRDAGVGRVDLITAGPPCQPRSAAGKRGGAADHRDLWPQVSRVVAEIRPRAVVVEQPAGLLTMDAADWVADLERAGYEVGVVVLPAAAVGAPHLRERVFLLAYAERNGVERWGGSGNLAGTAGKGQENGEERQWNGDAAGDSTTTLAHPASQRPGKEGRLRHNESTERIARSGSPVADAEIITERAGLRPSYSARLRWGRSGNGSSASSEEARAAQSGMGRVASGFSSELDSGRITHIWPAPPGPVQYDWEPTRTSGDVSHRRERLQALGNAVVPQLAYEVLMALLAADDETREAP